MRKDAVAFIVRSQPPHLGHLHALKELLKKHARVVIAIGSANVSRTRDNPLTFAERKRAWQAMLRAERLLSRVAFIPLNDSKSDKKWREHVLKEIKRLRVEGFASQNAWVKRCLRSVLVQVRAPKYIERAILKGTRIRRNVVADQAWVGRVHPAVAKYLSTIHFKERLRAIHSSKRK